MPTISYAILACNEAEELTRLLDILSNKISSKDEIIVVLDETNYTQQVKIICDGYKNSCSNFSYYTHPLNKDFATQKNFLNSKCTKEWIFNIDADEYPSDILIENISSVLEDNPELDLIAVPRVNLVEGLTEKWISEWRWIVDSKKRVNWPDFQLRIYRNKPEIKWEGKVHERPVGYKAFTAFPDTDDNFALYHPKTIERQIKQNNLYDTI